MTSKAPHTPSGLIWSIALPAMLTNVATALFGLADMWVIGRLGDAPAQGAVELGAKFMVGVFTVFNFLRTGTIALTAQAAGRGDGTEQAAALTRAVATGLAIGIVLLALKPWTVSIGLSLLEAEGEVASHARTYVGIRYWAGAIMLVNFTLIGWLIGQRRVKTVLSVEVAANVVHVALDLLLVLGFGWGVAGVAIATVASELLKFVALAVLVGLVPGARLSWTLARERATWTARAFAGMFALNRDLFLRTILLMSALMIFARAGAQQGPVVLAANGILFQLFMLSTLLLDGFESAAQVLCGEARGAADRARFLSMTRLNLVWGAVSAIVLTLIYLLAGGPIAATFSTDARVVATAQDYVIWIVLMPVIGLVSFVLDGVFVGAGWTRAMLISMAIGMAIYVVMLYLASPLTNTGLWLAFAAFFVVRGVGLYAMMPRLVARDFSAS